MKFDRQTVRLSLSYLMIIMALSAIFSVVIYTITTSQMNRPIPPKNQQSYETTVEFQQRMELRDAETRQAILLSLFALNGMMLVFGAGLSYLLARRTLAPIEAAMDAQVQFVSDASHELRTPLTALMTTNEVALRKKTLDDGKARAVFQRNIDEVGKLRELTNNLLSLTQADKQQLDKSPLDVGELIDEVITRYQPAADKKQITIEREITAQQLTANRAALSQVLGTLLDNAIKYSPNGETVTIKFDGTNFKVVDRGAGIAAADQARIFDRFYRSDAARTRTDQSGYGLGLAIAKAICDRHGYKLSVSSREGEGSTFVVKTR